MQIPAGKAVLHGSLTFPCHIPLPASAWHPAVAPALGPKDTVIDTRTDGPRMAGLSTLSPREAAWLAWQALDSSDDIVLLLESAGAPATADTVVIAANGAFRRASGYAPEQIIGRLAVTLIPNAIHAGTFMKAIRERTSLRSELAFGRADGGTFLLGLHLMPAPEPTEGRACFALLG